MTVFVVFQGALYFGMETILSDCKMWLIKAISVNRVPLLQLNDLVHIWEFGSEIGEFTTRKQVSSIPCQIPISTALRGVILPACG